MSDLTIVVVARERFSVAGRVLRRIIDVTPEPYRLLIVDAGTPEKYRREMEQAVAGRRDVDFLRTDRYLMPSAAKRWALDQVNDGEFVMVTENDIEPEPRWMELLLGACREEGADVARPAIFERRAGRTRAHFNASTGTIESVAVTSSDRPAYRFRPTKPRRETSGERRRVQTVESHCLLIRRDVFQKTEVFDKRLCPIGDSSISLELFHAGIPVVFEPAARVTFLAPPPVEREEREFFDFVWDMDAARNSLAIFQEKWNIGRPPEAADFSKHRQAHISYWRFWAYWLRHEMWQFEVGPVVRYRLYQASAALPPILRRRFARMLYR